MVPVLKKIGKWILRILAGIILLLLVLWLLLQTQWGKNLVKDKAVSYLKDKLKTEVRIESIDVDWFNRLQLKGVYLEDRQKRELAYIGNLETKYSLANIFRNKLTIGTIRLDEVRAAVLRSANDSVFNYQFIIDAFASTEPAKTDSSKESKPFILELKDLELNNVRLLMDDQYGGQVYKLSAGYLKTRFRDFDLDKMKIGVNYFYTDSVNASISLLNTSKVVKQSEGKTTISTTAPAPFNLDADSIHLGRTAFYFSDASSGMLIDSKAHDIGAAVVKYDQVKMNLIAGSFVVNDHSTAFRMKAAPGESKKDSTMQVSEASQPFTFFVKKLDIDKNNFSMDNDAVPAAAAKNSIDFNHFSFQQIGLHADSIAFDGNTYTAVIKDAVLAEKSGFRLSQLKGRAVYNDTNVVINGLSLITNNSRLEGNIGAAFTSLDNITLQPENTRINAAIVNSNLQLNDLLYFSPDLAANPNFAALLGKTFFIHTNVYGTLKSSASPHSL
ncbi:MAG: AsmA family protein [Ferruginibacter sp.]